MHLQQGVSRQLQHLCDSVGTGMKCLLMDADTLSSVSVACPQSTLMGKGVYLFEKLEDARNGRTPGKHRRKQLKFVTCVCLVRPTRVNINALVDELQHPRFGRYHIYLTHRASKVFVKELAEADLEEAVAGVYEIAMDFCTLDSHLFLTTHAKEKQLTTRLSFSRDYQRSMDGLLSLLTALDMDVKMCHAKNSDVCADFARELEDKWSQFAPSPSPKRQSANLLVFDRRLDPVTPLLNQWTYQAMIHELFDGGIKKNMVDLSSYDVPRDLQQRVLISSESDDFFRANMYKNFGEIGETVKALVASFQDQVKTHQKMDSIGDIKDFLVSYPEFRKMSGTVSKHVSLMSEMSRIVSSRHLLQMSETEQNLCGGGQDADDAQAGIRELLARTDITPMDVKRLLILYSMKTGGEIRFPPKEVAQYASVCGMEMYELKSLVKRFHEFSQSRPTRLMGGLSGPVGPGGGGVGAAGNKLASSAKTLLRGLRGVENVYTQHQPLLRDLLVDLARKRQSQDLNYSANFAFSPNIIVHVIGGITYEESRLVYSLNRELGCNIVLGGCHLWRTEDFLDYATAQGNDIGAL